MSRDSSGTFTLLVADKNPLDELLSADWNSLWNDIKTEMTDSLNRSGKGGMLAPLKLADGSKALPGAAFSAEVSSGLYRASAGNVRLSVLDTDVLTATTTLLTANVNLAATLATAAQPNITSLGSLTALTVAGAIAIDQNSNAVSMSIDSEATTASLIVSVVPSVTTGIGIDFQGFDFLTTGGIALFKSNASGTETRDLVNITNDNASATGATCLKIQQDASKSSLDISHNAAGGNAINITAASQATDVISVTADFLTTGGIALFKSNAPGTETRDLICIVNDNTLATGATCLNIQQDASKSSLDISHNAAGGNAIIITAASQAANVISVTADSLTTGNLAMFFSDSSNSSARSIAQLTNNNASATSTVILELIQNAAFGFIDFVGTAGANTTDPVSTFNTSAVTTDHIKIRLNGADAWVAVSTTPPTA